MPTRSCGEVTITTPSTGRPCKTVSGTSPVPGGMSTNMKSTSSQSTSLQNWAATPAITGPRQSTGSAASSSRRLMLMSCMPLSVETGYMKLSPALALPATPKAAGMEGPVRSASMTAVR